MSLLPERVTVTRTYLELRTSPADASADEVDQCSIQEIANCDPSLYRRLYRDVGGRYHWVDRLEWSDDEIRRHLSRPAVSLWLMQQAGDIAGYFELCAHDDGSVEIAYIGLLPAFVGSGMGGALVTAAAGAAWSRGANRVWLHTCTLDDPRAMPTYLRLGFTPCWREIYETTIAPEEWANAGWLSEEDAPRR